MEAVAERKEPQVDDVSSDAQGRAMAEEKTVQLTPWRRDYAILGGGEPMNVAEMRRDGLETFERVGFPTLKQEVWKYTDVKPIAEAGFPRASAVSPATELTEDMLAPWRVEDAHELVFVNGTFAEEHSRLAELPAEAVALPLTRAFVECPAKVEAHIGRYARFDGEDAPDMAFAALNAALFHDGGFVHLGSRVVVERPIHLLFVTTARDVAVYPRNLIVAGRSSQGTVIESYVGLSTDGAAEDAGSEYFTCPVTEASVADDAYVDHYKLQRESAQAFHVATQQSRQGRSCNFRSHSISVGGGLVRNDLKGWLGGEGSDCTLNGLYLVTDRQRVDNHMKVDHAEPHCTSHETYKGVLEGRGRSVFNGLLYVHPDAQKTDAKQSNQNLLLSKDALANSNPQLEIFADDVRCTHGSTVGELDEDAVFYLRSRGLGEAAAKSLLTFAFASEVVSQVRVEAVRKALEEYLFGRLPRGEVVRQAI